MNNRLHEDIALSQMFPGYQPLSVDTAKVTVDPTKIITVNPVVGKKYDADKPMYDLIPPDALDEVVKNLTFGAKKYSPENWRKVEDAKRRYFAAAQRHMWAWKRGEIKDPENDLHHFAAAIVNLMFVLQLELEENNT